MEAWKPADDSDVTINESEASPNNATEENIREKILDAWTMLPAVVKISQMPRTEKRIDDENECY